MSMDLSDLARKIKEKLKDYYPIVITGNLGTGKSRLLWVVERSVRPYAWHHGGVDEHGNLYPKMKKRFAIRCKLIY